MSISQRRGVALLATAAIAIAACGGDGASTAPTAAPGTGTPATQAPTGAPLSGTLQVGGSSTVFLISEAVVEEFRIANPGIQGEVAIDGTGGGLERFCNGELQVTGASRPIKADDEDEIPACTANNVEYVELQIALDGLSVVVDLNNTFADCFTVAELNKIYAADAPEHMNWSDVRAGWPAEEIERWQPDAQSGTFDFFTAEINGEEGSGTQFPSTYTDDNQAVTGVTGNPNAVAYFGYGYLVENTDKVKAVPVDGGEGCVGPSPETILDGSYAPLSRPLFIYANVAEIQSKPEVAAFVKFYLDNSGALAPEVGFVAMPGDLLTTEQAELDAVLP